MKYFFKYYIKQVTEIICQTAAINIKPQVKPKMTTDLQWQKPEVEKLNYVLPVKLLNCKKGTGREMKRMKYIYFFFLKKESKRSYSPNFYQQHSSTGHYIQSRCSASKTKRKRNGMGEVQPLGEERLFGGNVFWVKQHEEMVA